MKDTDTASVGKKEQRAENARCCSTCPFLEKMKDHPGEKPMRTMWSGLRHGQPMICHSTDPDAHQYNLPNNAQQGNERMCVGALTYIYEHVSEFEQLLDHYKDNTNKAYKAYALKYKKPMLLKGLFEWAFALATGRTALIGGLVLPVSIAHRDDEQIRRSWNTSGKSTMKRRLLTGQSIDLSNGEDCVLIWFQSVTSNFCLSLNGVVIKSTKTWPPIEKRLNRIKDLIEVQ